jgi:hypothetical protein
MKFLVAALLALASVAANANASFTNVTITSVTPWTGDLTGGSGWVVVKFSALGSEGCGSSNSNELLINLSSQSGMAAAAVAITAHTTGATVSAAGVGTCNVYSSIETLGTITF